MTTPDDLPSASAAEAARPAPRFGFLDQSNPRYAVPAWATLEGLGTPEPARCGTARSLLPRSRAVRAGLVIAVLGQAAYASQGVLPQIAGIFC